MIVEGFYAVLGEPSLAVVEADDHRIVRDSNHPEHVVSIDVQVVIMNLVCEIGRSGRTGVEVQSDKGERPRNRATANGDEIAFTETHIGAKG